MTTPTHHCEDDGICALVLSSYYINSTSRTAQDYETDQVDETSSGHAPWSSLPGICEHCSPTRTSTRFAAAWPLIPDIMCWRESNGGRSTTPLDLALVATWLTLFPVSLSHYEEVKHTTQAGQELWDISAPGRGAGVLKTAAVENTISQGQLLGERNGRVWETAASTASPMTRATI